LALFRHHPLRWTIPLLAILTIALASPLWLRAAGNFLVRDETPFHGDMLVVLAGDDHGNRILKAAELARRGFAPQILVSGPYCCYGNVESDLAIAFAVRKGYPAEWFVSFPIHDTSTATEVPDIVRELERRRVGRFVVVTSNYHTRRTAEIFRRHVPADRFRVVAAPDWAFRPEDWWRSRDGRKQAFLEWTKTLATWVGL
jgi:uncharacterized SAM-binding protein YcdF (DUF218 family)